MEYHKLLGVNGGSNQNPYIDSKFLVFIALDWDSNVRSRFVKDRHIRLSFEKDLIEKYHALDDPALSKDEGEHSGCRVRVCFMDY